MIDEKKLIEEIKSLRVTVTGLRAGKGILREFEKQYKESILRIIEERPKVGDWIPCSERLPKNAKHKGAFCPKYWVMTKYGQTIGWYNPDFESWFILVWFITSRYLETEIDFDRADIPKVVKVPLKMEIVTAWQPLPEPYNPGMVRKQTNSDRIRAMTDEELAELLKEVKADYQWLNQDYPNEEDAGEWEEWLQTEVEE